MELENIKKLKPKIKVSGTPGGTPGRPTSEVESPEKRNSDKKTIEAPNLSTAKP